MRVAFFSAHQFEKEFFTRQASSLGQEIVYFDVSLNRQTAPLTKGFDAVCCFVSDTLDEPTLRQLRQSQVRLVALRSAGYNNVDLKAADDLGIPVVRVPAYSPHAVAEHAVGLLLSLNRKIHRAYMRVRELNFSLEGLMGFDLYNKTIGVLGTGRIGAVFASIMHGFGCEVIAFDPHPDASLVDRRILKYVSLDELYRRSDVISLHLPLLPNTQHLLSEAQFRQMKAGVLLINTGRGALIDSRALIDALKSGHVGGAALDVYEEEEGIFFKDLSDQILQDDVLARLLTFPNVLITSHEAFLTREALEKIAETTLQNIQDFENGRDLIHQVRVETHVTQK